MVNPLYLEADGEGRKQTALLARKRCECDSIVLCDDIEPDKVTEYETKKSALQEAVREITRTVTDLKACRKATPRHVHFADLPPEDRFRMLGMEDKYFVDTINLIAYQAETTMAPASTGHPVQQGHDPASHRGTECNPDDTPRHRPPAVLRIGVVT